jgi:hypothetical protein
MCEIGYPLVTFTPHIPNFRGKDGIPVCLLLRHLHTFGTGHHKCKQIVHGFRCSESEGLSVEGYRGNWGMATRKLFCIFQESKLYLLLLNTRFQNRITRTLYADYLWEHSHTSCDIIFLFWWTLKCFPLYRSITKRRFNANYYLKYQNLDYTCQQSEQLLHNACEAWVLKDNVV